MMQRRPVGRLVMHEHVNSNEDADFLIEDVDSDEEVKKTADIAVRYTTKNCCVLMNDIRRSLVQYIRYIGEDRGFFADDTTHLAEAFENWTSLHSVMTEVNSTWSRIHSARVFIGSSRAHDLFKNPHRVLKCHPPYNIAAQLPPYQQQNYPPCFSTFDTQMGIEMENIIRQSHVPFFSQPLEAVKPGQVVSTHNMIGASCSGDIELLDSEGQVVSLLEVKTLCKAKVPPGIWIPDTKKRAREVVRELLGKHGQFNKCRSSRANIFRQDCRFVDINMLRMYGHKHAAAQKKKYAVHSHVHESLFLESCKVRKGQFVDIYFYEPGNKTGKPEQTFSMSVENLGLVINPWSSTTMQMLWQECVYNTSTCITVNKQQIDLCAWMNLLLVVPYNTDVENTQPYLIMKMPILFSSELCKQVHSFYAATVHEYISHSQSTNTRFHS